MSEMNKDSIVSKKQHKTCQYKNFCSDMNTKLHALRQQHPPLLIYPKLTLLTLVSQRVEFRGIFPRPNQRKPLPALGQSAISDFMWVATEGAHKLKIRFK
jgi:hypothetical protein